MTPVGDPPPTASAPSVHPSPARPGDRWAAVSGVLACAVTLAVASLVAVLFGPSSNPAVAVGGAFVDATPAWLKDAAIAAFGTNDKVALFAGMAIAFLLLGALIGLVAARHLRVALGLVAAVGAVGLAAVLTRSEHARWPIGALGRATPCRRWSAPSPGCSPCALS